MVLMLISRVLIGVSIRSQFLVDQFDRKARASGSLNINDRPDSAFDRRRHRERRRWPRPWRPAQRSADRRPLTVPWHRMINCSSAQVTTPGNSAALGGGLSLSRTQRVQMHSSSARTKIATPQLRQTAFDQSRQPHLLVGVVGQGRSRETNGGLPVGRLGTIGHVTRRY